MKKIIFSSLLTIAVLGGFIVLLSNNADVPATSISGQSNVSVVDGKQVIQIDAKGGYLPRRSDAHANMSTILNVKTNGTFDCSSAISIPQLGYQSNLPPSGVTSIEIPPQPAGTTIKGICAMGMYSFAVNFN